MTQCDRATPPDSRLGGRPNLLLAAMLAQLFLLVPLRAQPVFGPTTPPAPNPAALHGLAASPTGAAPPLAVPAPVSTPFRWAGIAAHPQISYRRAFADGMQIRPGVSGDTYLTTMSPGVMLELGSKWMANYVQNWSRYSNPEFDNNTGYTATLAGAFPRTDWNLNFNQTYSSSTEVLIETGRQTRQQLSKTRLSASRQAGPKVAIGLSADQSLSFIDRTEDPYEWSGSGSLSYQVASALDCRLVLGGGYLAIERTADSVYLRPTAGVNWRLTEKSTLSIDAGMERRKLLGGTKRQISNPTYSISLQMQPTQTTALSFEASRAVKHSYFRSELTKGTDWSVSLQQRLLKHFQLAGSYGRHRVQYFGTTAAAASGRRDSSTNYSVRLSTVILRRLSIAGFFQHSENSSTIPGFGFTSRQMGGEIALQY